MDFEARLRAWRHAWAEVLRMAGNLDAADFEQPLEVVEDLAPGDGHG